MGLKNYLNTPAGRLSIVNSLLAIVGASNVRALYMPAVGEGSVVADGGGSGRNWTHGNSPVGRITPLGYGAALSFNGTSDYLTTPDADAFSFGNGAVDSPFSAFIVANVTDTANARRLIAKWDTSNQEWIFGINPSDLLNVQMFDQSVAAQPFRNADAALTQGAWGSLGFSYAGAGGAASADGITQYQNGVPFASTATNAPTYVAMENLASAVEIGSNLAHTSSFLAGSLALVLLVAGLLSATQMTQLHSWSRSYGLVP